VQEKAYLADSHLRYISRSIRQVPRDSGSLSQLFAVARFWIGLISLWKTEFAGNQGSGGSLLQHLEIYEATSEKILSSLW
jgi:hypothetical protein